MVVGELTAGYCSEPLYSPVLLSWLCLIRDAIKLNQAICWAGRPVVTISNLPCESDRH